MLMKIMSWFLSVLSSPFVDKVLQHLERKADTQTERERLKTQVQLEAIKAVAAEHQSLAQYNTAKLGNWVYWIFVSLFILPLGIWWAGVMLDSTFRFGWGVASLPQGYIIEWAGNMIQWLFYVGSGALVMKTIFR